MTSSPVLDAVAESDAPVLPTVDDVRGAARRIAAHARTTPLLRSDVFDERIGGRLFVKAEPLQYTGAFKFRGAFNCISSLSADERARGVIAYSSGNHAQAVAAAARLLETPATIVMPRDAPAIKLAGTRRQGAEIVLYDRWGENREAIATEIMRERGASLVKPYDDPRVIAGQGTVGLEIAAQCGALGVTPDIVVSPAGGGGLMAGVSLAISDAFPDAAIYTAEPEGFDDHARSFAAGERLGVDDVERKCLCDALLARAPGVLTFQINRTRVRSGVAVSDDAVLDAMADAFLHLKLVVEPGGAVALAAVLTGLVQAEGRTVVAVISGGNVDPETFDMALQRARDRVA